MIPQLTCLALIALLAVLRGPQALRRPQARPAWWATIAGTVSLTTYGVPVPQPVYDRFLGGQNFLTLVRDLAAIAALWFLREALAGYSRSAKRYAAPWRLGAALALVACPFLLIPHRSPTSATLVMDQIVQPASWLYGIAYMGVLTWLLLDSARITLRVSRGVVRVIAAGALVTATGCMVEIVVLTAAHLGWGGGSFRDAFSEASAAPFFTGLTVMLLGVAGATVVLPARRRLLVGRLHRLGRHWNLPAGRRALPLAVLGSEQRLAAQTHTLLIELGNAQHAGQLSPTEAEHRVIRRAQALFRPDDDFRPTVVGKAA